MEDEEDHKIAEEFLVKHISEVIHKVGGFDRFRNLV
jgi:hypothetical protein